MTPNEKQVSKEQFKQKFLEYGSEENGWTEEYWNSVYEKKSGCSWFFSPPESEEHSQMFIIHEPIIHCVRMYFLKEVAVEAVAE